MSSSKWKALIGPVGGLLTFRVLAEPLGNSTCNATDLPWVIHGWDNVNVTEIDTDIFTTLMAQAVVHDPFALQGGIVNLGNSTFQSRLSFPNRSIFIQTTTDPGFTGNASQVSLSAAVDLMNSFKEQLPDHQVSSEETYLLPAFWGAAPLQTAWCDLKFYQAANVVNPYSRPAVNSPVIAILDSGLVALDSSTLGSVNLSKPIPTDLSGYNVSYWAISSTGCPELRTRNTVEWYRDCASLVFVM